MGKRMELEIVMKDGKVHLYQKYVKYEHCGEYSRKELLPRWEEHLTNDEWRKTFRVVVREEDLW